MKVALVSTFKTDLPTTCGARPCLVVVLVVFTAAFFLSFLFFFAATALLFAISFMQFVFHDQ
jgi:hypothetical protein